MPDDQKDPEILELAERWLELDKDPTTRSEIERLVAENDINALRQCMHPRISFGTAGLRARVAAGFARMNGLVVIQTSNGLAAHLLSSHNGAWASTSREVGVVVGHDARHGSAYFARLAAAAFLAHGQAVQWLGEVHTPLVPFTVRRAGAAAGVMITASHNPPQDNGYKVYAGHGGQINMPDDGLIARLILDNATPLSWDTHAVDAETECVRHVRDDSVKAYNAAIARQVSFRHDALPRFVYTPLHGVGFRYMAGAFAAARGAVEPRTRLMELVPEQVSPDPDFPTVRYPNPEEDGALEPAKRAADTLGVSLILANDPDADRFAAAEKMDDGRWHQFKGDDLGVLLGYYLFERMGRDVARTKTMLTSAVSSQMLAAVGAAEGFAVEETLTGFKWIGNRAREIGVDAVFGYEEALGYMLPDVVFDKDGVATAMLFLEMCSRVGSPYARLQQLYARYGYFETVNTYWKSPSVALTTATLQRIQQDPTMIGPLGADLKQTRTRDLMKGTDTGTPDGKATLWSSPDNMMITVWHAGNAVFRDGVRYTVRASGTEPKIKVYIECRSKVSTEEAREGALAVFRAIGKSWFSDPDLRVEERFESLLKHDD